MEVQTTDFENAAYTCLAVLLSRVILSFDLSLYMPLSLVDENFRRAHGRDAVRTQRFHFPRHVAPLVDPANAASSLGGCCCCWCCCGRTRFDPHALRASLPLCRSCAGTRGHRRCRRCHRDG